MTPGRSPLLRQHFDHRSQREIHALPFSRIQCGARVPLSVKSKNSARLDSRGNNSNAPSAAGTTASALIRSMRRSLRSRMDRSSSRLIPSSILRRTTRGVATMMAAIATGGLVSLCDATPSRRAYTLHRLCKVQSMVPNNIGMRHYVNNLCPIGEGTEPDPTNSQNIRR